MPFTPEAKLKADAFLLVAPAFQLGALPTEQRHPATGKLAELARTNPIEALRILKQIDLGVVWELRQKEPALAGLRAAVRDTLNGGGRIFLYGCGATGRLSISVEHFWRALHEGRPEADYVRAFMSGGDLALVHSIENFEDHPEWGERQLREIGFREGDLLVATTEGGETPSVIGCTEAALALSSRAPFFLYCNPDEILRAHVERSRRVLDNPRIEKVCLFVGPMSLSGSTRLQASTALLIAVAESVLAHAYVAGPRPDLGAFLKFLEDVDCTFLRGFAEEEAALYAKGHYLLYETNDYGITILTDTTERAPTFSLRGFENQTVADRKPALSYLSLPQTKGPEDAWRKILYRDPLALEWEELGRSAGRVRLFGFDFSGDARAQREALVGRDHLHRFEINREEGAMLFRLGAQEHRVRLTGLHPYYEHLFLKLALNMHSQLVMGRIGRFESNVMTWVKPSNNKLVDRAVRYVEFLLANEGAAPFSYEEITRELFEQASGSWADEAVVLKTVAALKARAPGSRG